MARTAEVLQLQAKAERQRLVDYEPGFTLDIEALDALTAIAFTEHDVGRAAAARHKGLHELAALLSPAALGRLGEIASAANELTLRRFGRTMHMFAPLYLSNECVSECTYCGFQVWNRDIARRTLRPPELLGETRYLKHQGFRHLLLVSGEHPKHVTAEYIEDCIRACASNMPSIAVEVQVWDEDVYRRFVRAGCEGLVVYQETYDERVYPQFHLKGNKRFFAWRLGAPERGGRAGMRRIGLGTLVGLNPNWRWELLALASHARFIMRRFWQCEVTVALPRLEPAAGAEHPPHVMTDAELAQAICALRLVLPDAGIVLSSREPARLRDGLARLGVTHMSAGSRTEPGGYLEPGEAEEQFRVGDTRGPAEVASMLRSSGYDVVWKDSSPALRSASADRL